MKRHTNGIESGKREREHLLRRDVIVNIHSARVEDGQLRRPIRLDSIFARAISDSEI